MTRDLNKVQLTGRLGADPELRLTPQGHTVVTFRVASNRSWRNAEGEPHEDTEWFRVVAWNKLAEICNQWLSKASRVYVEGRLQTRQWHDQDGQPRVLSEVVASDIIILDMRRSPVGATPPAPPAPADAAPSVPHAQAALTAPARIVKAVALPRGPAAFAEEDLPF